MKLTPEKFKKIKVWTFLCLAAYIIFLILFNKYTMKINPEAFTYIPMMEANPWEDTLNWAYRFIAFGFAGIGFILVRDVKQHKDHKLRKAFKFIREMEDEGGEDDEGKN